jgi:hypothetical protein
MHRRRHSTPDIAIGDVATREGRLSAPTSMVDAVEA